MLYHYFLIWAIPRLLPSAHRGYGSCQLLIKCSLGKKNKNNKKWDECKAAVVGVEGAKFKGFDLLEDAKRAWRDGPGS